MHTAFRTLVLLLLLVACLCIETAVKQCDMFRVHSRNIQREEPRNFEEHNRNVLLRLEHLKLQTLW